jgi:hypothetical protein
MNDAGVEVDVGPGERTELAGAEIQVASDGVELAPVAWMSAQPASLRNSAGYTNVFAFAAVLSGGCTVAHGLSARTRRSRRFDVHASFIIDVSTLHTLRARAPLRPARPLSPMRTPLAWPLSKAKRMRHWSLIRML